MEDTRIDLTRVSESRASGHSDVIEYLGISREEYHAMPWEDRLDLLVLLDRL